MTPDELWELFCDTGDPLCWLMCRGAESEHDGASE